MLPLITRYFHSEDFPLNCLQIEPDDEDEAVRLRQDGHRCEVLLARSDRIRERTWERPPLVADPLKIPFESDSFDLILTGVFGKITDGLDHRLSVARELARVCRKNGAFLTSIDNRCCPIDLTGNAPGVHSFNCSFALSLEEMESIFVGESGFSKIYPLNISNHFGMTRVTGPAKIVAWLLRSYWKRIATPERRWLYKSPLNPLLILWIEK